MLFFLLSGFVAASHSVLLLKPCKSQKAVETIVVFSIRHIKTKVRLTYLNISHSQQIIHVFLPTAASHEGEVDIPYDIY